MLVLLSAMLPATALHAQSQSQSQSQAASRSAQAEAATPEAAPGTPVSSSSAGARRAEPFTTLNSMTADYVIGPNDLIDIEVYGIPDLKRTVRVNSSGQVSLALAGTVRLGGYTAQQAEMLIAGKYSEKYLQDPQVSVFIREFTSQRITIEGAVGRPGIYPVTGQVTLLKALALAGGGAAYSDLSQIMVFRPDAKGVMTSQKHNLDKIRAGEVPDPAILADDVIVVRRDPMRAALRDSLFRDVIDSINPFSSVGK
ncbi:MAG: polysaccharide biosynthesis/export family protein [Pseudomonadota bacterium]